MRLTRALPGLRWWIAGLVFLATLINFVNRLAISVLAPVIIEQLKLSNTGFAVSIVVWSLASMAHAFARGLVGLNCFRFVLGLGEAGNWPGAAKVIAEWFPVRQRALGMAIFNSGTSIGSIVAPPLIGRPAVAGGVAAGASFCGIARRGPSWSPDSSPTPSGGCTSRGCRCTSTGCTASA